MPCIFADTLCLTEVSPDKWMSCLLEVLKGARKLRYQSYAFLKCTHFITPEADVASLRPAKKLSASA